MQFDLEQRTFQFALRVSHFCRHLSRCLANYEYTKQLIRSSASVGSNYIEANESLGRKDFLLRVKICRKEAKESAYWLTLIRETNESESLLEVPELLDEANQLRKIFSAIIARST